MLKRNYVTVSYFVKSQTVKSIVEIKSKCLADVSRQDKQWRRLPRLVQEAGRLEYWRLPFVNGLNIQGK